MLGTHKTEMIRQSVSRRARVITASYSWILERPRTHSPRPDLLCQGGSR